MNPVPYWPFIPVLMEPLVWLAVLAAVRPARDRALFFYTLILVIFGTAVTGYFTGSLGHIPWTIAVSYLIAAAVAFFGRKVTSTRGIAGVAIFATAVLWIALGVTLEMKGVVDRTLACVNCVPELRDLTGQQLKIRYEGQVGTFTNAGYAKAHEQANINHAAVLRRLAERNGQPFPARVALVYTFGKLSGADIVGIDGIKFENFKYMGERTEKSFIEAIGR